MIDLITNLIEAKTAAKIPMIERMRAVHSMRLILY
jgi:hypothetical protein